MIEITREENLKCRAEALNLQFTPKTAFLATNTIHDTRYVAEVMTELIFQFPGLLAPRKHGRLIEMRAKVSEHVNKFDYLIFNYIKLSKLTRYAAKNPARLL